MSTRTASFKRRTFQATREQHRFSNAAVARLEDVWRVDPIPSRETRLALARELSVSERQVQVWLQNKRQRTKARRLRELDHLHEIPIEGGEPFDAIVLPHAELCPLVGEAQAHDDMQMEIFIEARAPFQVLWASNGWLSFCGFKHAELKGKTMTILQGPATDDEAAKKLTAAGEGRCRGVATLVNYTKSRVPFRHTVHIEPLVNSFGQLRMFKACSTDIEVLPSLEGSPHGCFPAAKVEELE